jgi:16S rRNA (guanine527-N7)-methyltransferase
MSQGDLSKILQEGAESLGLSLTNDQIKMFIIYFHELKEWGKKMNLFRRSDDREIILKDFLDSLTVIKYFPECAAIVDLGSGAGFPGVPIKIARPDLTVFLLEATQKKIYFLKSIQRILNLKKMDVLWSERINKIEMKKNLGPFNFVVSRAFGSLQKFANEGLPLLNQKGILLAMKGKNGEDDLKKNLPALEKIGLRLIFSDPILLPMMGHKRILIGLQNDCST